MEVKEMKQAFAKAYGKEATAVYFSPGRVNLIGEHTDYNGGSVFPCALSFGTYLLLAPNGTQTMRFKSLNMPEVVEVPVDKITEPLPGKSWVNYPMGCFAWYVRQGPFRLGTSQTKAPCSYIRAFITKHSDEAIEQFIIFVCFS